MYFQSALDRLMSGRTVLVVAHRLSTIRDAHKIVVFQHGKLVETGTHEQLMQMQRGVYRDLVTKQSAAKKEAGNGDSPSDSCRLLLHCRCSGELRCVLCR